VIALLALFLAFADLGALKSEPDPDRRSELALANGDHSIDAARKAYTDGDDKAVDAALEELQESVNISYDALEHASKAPRNNRYYKSAELKVRALIRRLSSFHDEVSFETSQHVEKVIKRLSDVHDELIEGIMSKKKK